MEKAIVGTPGGEKPTALEKNLYRFGGIRIRKRKPELGRYGAKKELERLEEEIPYERRPTVKITIPNKKAGYKQPRRKTTRRRTQRRSSGGGGTLGGI